MPNYKRATRKGGSFLYQLRKHSKSLAYVIFSLMSNEHGPVLSDEELRKLIENNERRLRRGWFSTLAHSLIRGRAERPSDVYEAAEGTQEALEKTAQRRAEHEAPDQTKGS
jgi:hypothetical protein